eukprot:scaffold8496_cov66-Cyclotella_meneghiniana.AAC.23
MSGPLARSAHMRMKMKRERSGGSGTTPQPSPRNAPLSPAGQTVNKDLLLAAAVTSTATISPEISETPLETAKPHQVAPSPSPRSLSNPVAIRSRSRSRSTSRARASIHSLESEGNYIVNDVFSSTAPSPRGRRSPYGSKAKSAFEFDGLSPKNNTNPITPNHPRSIFNSASLRHVSSRSRKTYDFPTDRFDVQQLQNQQKEQMENVRRQNEEVKEMHGRRKNQLSPKNDACEFEAFDPFSPSPLTIPGAKSGDGFAAFQDDFEAFPTAPDPSPHQSRNPCLTINTSVPPHDSMDDRDVYSPKQKDGSHMMTIEGHDDNFVYPDSYEDHPEADLEYHTNNDEALTSSMDQTVNSEEALTGTPIRKKEEKKRKKKNQKFIIENVSSADSLDKKDPRLAIHANSWEEDEENVVPRSASKVRGHSVKYNEMAVTAKRYADFDGKRKKEALSPIGSESRKTMLPKRIGTSKSWDSSRGDEVRPINSSKSWDAKNEVDSHGWRNGTTKKQRNLWESNHDDDSEEKSPPRQRQIIGASKSWDNNIQSNADTSHNQENFFQSNPFGNSTKVDENPVVQEEFADWDGAGVEWIDPVQSMEVVPSDKAPGAKVSMDWNKKGAKNMQEMIPVEFETPNATDSVSDYEEDEDSIFAFSKKEEEQKEVELPPPPPANPQDIFAKLNSGLKQANSNKIQMSALRQVSTSTKGDSLSVADSDFSKETSLVSEQTSEKSKEKRNVAFAKDKDNTIHTYLVEDNHFDTRDSTSNAGSTDDEVGTETDPESSVDTGIEVNTSPRNQSEGQPTSQKKKSVHYQSDEDVSYHTNEESTLASSFKSNPSAVVSDQEQTKELNLLDHVTGLAASLGGLFSSPKNADEKTIEDKSVSVSTDQDDNTYTQSSLPSQDNNTSGDDWFGYMEKPDDEQSVHTEGESTGSPLTDSQYSKSHDQSSKFTYDSYPEDDDDAYLLQQALASARAVHHIHGVEYDESQEIDVVTDVKFHVANIKLPLGLLFQEHEIGAWVSRVVPNGNGARKGVQPGDQLASIDGKSAVHASIDEVAAIISRTPKKKSVELTFLRYTGNLRPVPGAVIQEGFEVHDSSVQKRAPPRPPKKPTSPAKSKSRFFSKSPPSSPKEGSPAKSLSPKSNPSSPKTDKEVSNVDANNSRSLQKKKSTLGKMMSFKKTKK